MRSDQWVGLNERGAECLIPLERKWTKSSMIFWDDPWDPQSKPEFIDAEGTGIPPSCVKVYDTVEGAWQPIVGELHEYSYPEWNGVVMREFVQEEIWSSGPMYFVALKWFDPLSLAYTAITHSLWTSAEMNTY